MSALRRFHFQFRRAPGRVLGNAGSFFFGGFSSRPDPAPLPPTDPDCSSISRDGCYSLPTLAKPWSSLVLGMNAESKEGGVPTSEASGDSWDADDTPRLDDYFRGQVRNMCFSQRFGDTRKRTITKAISDSFILQVTNVYLNLAARMYVPLPFANAKQFSTSMERKIAARRTQFPVVVTFET